MGDILTDLRVSGEQSEVLVEPGRLRVVVAGAEMAVAPQLVTVVPHHHRELAVRLQADQSVDDVDSCLLQFSCPVDVVLLIEARLDLHEGEHLLAHLRRGDECIDDG